MILTKYQIQAIRDSRAQNYSYGAIAAALHLPVNTVKSYGYRHGMDKSSDDTVITIKHSDLKSCRWCGKLLDPLSRNTYCSKECRTRWHNHRNMEKNSHPQK